MKYRKQLLSYLIRMAFWPLCFIVMLFLYRGFFRPDPYVISRYAPFSIGLLWSLRIGIPLLLVYIVALLWGFKTKRMSRTNILTLMGSLIFCALIGLAVIYQNYNRKMESVSHFHPYLQISPVTLPEINQNNFNIFCLGGSTTEFTDSHGKGWPERVETILNQTLGRNDIRVYNLGKQWYTTQHSLIYYETSLRHNAPDAILIMHTINDLLNNADFSYFSRGPFRPDYGNFDGPIYRLVRPQGFFTFMGWMIKSMWYHESRDTIRTNTFPGLVSFRQNLNTLFDLAEIDQVPLVLMTQPNLYKDHLSPEEREVLYMLRFEAIGPEKQWDVSTAFEGMKQYRQAVLDIARKRHLSQIDLDQQIPKTLEYFKDDVHYTDTAFDRVAGIIAAALIDQLDLKNK